MFARKHIVRPRTAQPQSQLPSAWARYYNFPPTTAIWARRIAIVELGGSFNPATVYAYCQQYGYALPRLRSFNVDGQGQVSDGPQGADGEVQLDICVIAGALPGVGIDVFFAPNTSQGFADGIKAALVSGADAVSISWGAPESDWTDTDRALMESVLQTARVPVFVAAGDSGSSDGVTDPTADYPASSALTVGCGGTLVIDITNRTEVVWNDQYGATGGGFSSSVTRPPFQNSISEARYRGVPDLAGTASPSSGYVVYIDSTTPETVAGTSGVAPLLAALYVAFVSRLGGQLYPFTNVLYTAYAAPSGDTAYASVPSITTDITSGSNGFYSAGTGFDECTGLGVPNGLIMLTTFASLVNVPILPPNMSDPSPVVAPPVVPSSNLLGRLWSFFTGLLTHL